MPLLSTLIAFVVALGVLIVFHEFGHYLVARLCGVKVLRFSLGFGTPLWKRRLGRDGTEWAIAAFPLGGYVKMLDEREGPVAAQERHRAFNVQPVAKRFAIVLAGPVANFLLAILLYWLLFVHGLPGIRPVVGVAASRTRLRRTPDSMPGDLIRRIGDAQVTTWQDVRWVLLETALRKESVRVELQSERGDIDFGRLDLSGMSPEHIDGDLLQAVGITRYQPPLKPVIGRLIAGGAGERDGLKPGDEIIEVDGRPIAQWDELVSAISAAADRALTLRVKRADAVLQLTVTPEPKTEGGKTVGTHRRGAADRRGRDEKNVHRGALWPGRGRREGDLSAPGKYPCSRSRCSAR